MNAKLGEDSAYIKQAVEEVKYSKKVQLCIHF